MKRARGTMSTVVYIGGFELPDRNAAAQRVLNNARALRSLGYRVVLVGISHARPYNRRLHPADAGRADVEAWEIGYPTDRSDWFDHIRADWPVRALAEQGIIAPAEVAAVICYNYPAVAQWRIAHLARKWGAAAVADCTEWYGSRPWTTPANIVKNLDVPLRMRWVNRRMDGLITTSPFITQFYRSAGLPMVEIPTLMDREPTDASFGLAPGQPIPLFALASGFSADARPESIHDRIDWILDLLGEATQRGAGFSLKIAGVTEYQYLSLFPHQRPLLDRLGDTIHFLGRRPRVEILQMLRASAFAFVLRHESRVTLAGFPTKYSEAVTYGTPVIINELPSVRAYHIENRTGFTILPQDRDDAVGKLCDILAMDHPQIMEMKLYCSECDAFTVEAFKAPLAAFMSDVTRKGSACPSTD